MTGRRPSAQGAMRATLEMQVARSATAVGCLQRCRTPEVGHACRRAPESRARRAALEDWTVTAAPKLSSLSSAADRLVLRWLRATLGSTSGFGPGQGAGVLAVQAKLALSGRPENSAVDPRTMSGGPQ